MDYLHDIFCLLNDLVGINYLILDNHVVFHFMDLSTCIYCEFIVTPKISSETIDLYLTIWASQFGFRKLILADKALMADEFKDFWLSVRYEFTTCYFIAPLKTYLNQSIA